MTDKGVAKNRKKGGAFVDPGRLGTIVQRVEKFLYCGE